MTDDAIGTDRDRVADDKLLTGRAVDQLLLGEEGQEDATNPNLTQASFVKVNQAVSGCLAALILDIHVLSSSFTFGRVKVSTSTSVQGQGRAHHHIGGLGQGCQVDIGLQSQLTFG